MSMKIFTGLLFTAAASAYVLPPLQKEMERTDPRRSRRDCPMSPYALFLTNEQQQALHELITEARARGADEASVKTHMDKYITEVLPAGRYEEFKKENEKFERIRQRGKRSTEKRRPQRVFDLVDFYGGNGEENQLVKFYSDVTTKRLRQLH